MVRSLFETDMFIFKGVLYVLFSWLHIRALCPKYASTGWKRRRARVYTIKFRRSAPPLFNIRSTVPFNFISKRKTVRFNLFEAGGYDSLKKIKEEEAAAAAGGYRRVPHQLRQFVFQLLQLATGSWWWSLHVAASRTTMAVDRRYKSPFFFLHMDRPCPKAAAGLNFWYHSLSYSGYK